MNHALELFRALAALEAGHVLTPRQWSIIRDHRRNVDEKQRRIENRERVLMERDDD